MAAGEDVGVQGLESVVRRRVCLGRAMPSGPGWWHCSVGATLPSRAAPGLALLASLPALGTFVVAPSLARPRPCSLAHLRLLSTPSDAASLAPRSSRPRVLRATPPVLYGMFRGGLTPRAPREGDGGPDSLTPFHHRAL